MAQSGERAEFKIHYSSSDRVPRPWPAPSFGAWQIRQRAATSEQARLIIEGGATAIEAPDIGTVPADLDLSKAAVAFAPNRTGDAGWALLERAGSDDASLTAAFGIDPVAVAGSIEVADEAAIVAAAAVSTERFPGITTVGVDASTAEDPVDELARSMATAVRYLRVMTDGGLTIDDAAEEIEFTYRATADQFATIAKLWAARSLWQRVQHVCGANQTVQRQRAIASSDATSDPWRHQLEATVAAFAAGASGAQAVTVVPFNIEGTDYSAELAARSALNVHHLLLEEAHLADARDPANGAPFVESRADELARLAWASFRQLDSGASR